MSVVAMFSPTHPRTFSNKENSHSFSTLPSFPIPSSNSTQPPNFSLKPRIRGIGAAPKRNQHGSKPYARLPSINRAKKRATINEKPIKKIPQPLQLDKKTVLKAISVPFSTSPSVNYAPRQTVKMAKIPMKLPRPAIPPVNFIPGPLANVPIQYTLQRLTPHLPALLLVSSQYTPQPQYNSNEVGRSLAFGVQKVMNGDAESGAKLRGREPNVCLAIRKAGIAIVERLVPVNSLVYASHCSFWPSPSSNDDNIAKEDDQDVASTNDHSDAEEEEIEEGGSFDSDTSTITNNSISSTSTIVSTPPSVIQLPLLAIDIPHPASFATLHTHLHLPTRPLAPALLNINLPKNCFGIDITKMIKEDLSLLTIQQLMEKLEFMHGFWGNVCKLGISRNETWKEMEIAWELVVKCLKERATTK